MFNTSKTKEEVNKEKTLESLKEWVCRWGDRWWRQRWCKRLEERRWPGKPWWPRPVARDQSWNSYLSPTCSSSSAELPHPVHNTSQISCSESTKTECDYLYGWTIKRNSHIRKNFTQKWCSPEIQLGMQRKKCASVLVSYVVNTDMQCTLGILGSYFLVY